MRDFHLPGRSPVFAPNAICATSHPLAAQTALDILKAGGNAVDAALAAAFLLGICEPAMAGIGGDCFALLSPPNSDEVIALNGSGKAPAGLKAETLRQSGHKAMPLRDAQSVTIPGAIDAFCRLSADWGKLGLEQILAPAIHYAEQGIPVAPRVAFDWGIAARSNILRGAAASFYLKSGHAPLPGDLFRAPKQAAVLRRIAQHGREGFYTGEVAQDMVDSLRALGGAHEMQDFAKTASFYTDPISGFYKGTELVEHPPNGQGATAILMAKMLECFNLPDLRAEGAARIHIEAEVAKLAYDARDRFIADPSLSTRLDHMISTETAEKLAARIHPTKAMHSTAKISEAVHKDTVYLTVVDQNLMSVSLIYSIFHSFGSGLASDKFGILFQNRGAGFNLIPGHPNEADGEKRPMHTIIPGMIRQHGKVILPFGVMGGAYQPTGHARFLSNLVDYGMDIQSAIDGPRAFADGNILKLERAYPDSVAARLVEMGHRVEIPEVPIGGGQAIRIDHQRGVLMGASDHRKDGCAIGY
ncbi:MULTISPECIES: gamma-glutamyltransferase family protein [unclassified Aliiroseovarius]|uniref:gamma-glutamyltransferase family protein n=1 Tax=unclassified Aliiroseovarius TaxID=2623558 RepID=UPI001569FB69|nr:MULTISPECIES: gamma-glutamyltransferase family protein [unclassified Aliiroseovarius]NRP13488.1 putative gamma-glutamyltransferase YwrD [Aliiroseovarius sp. xm-d-517]NRP42659.1 putative gamma-glutamyltransferase YwrD [Aliiroseovarius sp. xm-m-339-2]NRP63571.1 putative gamma-glutamyltransferase YwrD [Aliiroseovarius sp. xm-a-151]